MMAILKKDQCFFGAFYYIKTRLARAKERLLKKIKDESRDKFIKTFLTESERERGIPKPGDLINQSLYIDPKYDLELKY